MTHTIFLPHCFRSRSENSALSTDYNQLQESYLELEDNMTHTIFLSHCFRSRSENSALSTDYNQLQESYLELEDNMTHTIFLSHCFRSRSENSALSTDYNQLQESYLELEELKDKLENKEITWQINLTDAQKTSDQSKTEVGDTLDTKVLQLTKYSISHD